MHPTSILRAHLSWLLLAGSPGLLLGCGGGAGDAPVSELSGSRESSPEVSPPPGASGSSAPDAAIPDASRSGTGVIVAPGFHRVGGPQDDVGTGLAVDGAGRVSLVWVSTPRQDADREPVPGERLALSLARYGADGERLWTRDFPRNRVDAPRVVASPDGALFVSGNAFLYDIDFGLGAASDGFLVKFSPDGEPLWQRRVGQKVYATGADGAGGVFVAGEEWTAEGVVPVLAHHESQGVPRWSRQLGEAARGTRLRAAALTDSGEWWVAGRLEGTLRVDGQDFGAPGQPSLLVLAFGPEGRLVWGRAWRGLDVEVTGASAAADGGVVLVGEHADSLAWGGTRLSGAGSFVLTVGAQGAERWARSLTCGPTPALPAVAGDGEGRVAAVCGDLLSLYTSTGTPSDVRVLPPEGCSRGDCPVTATALTFVPGQGLALTGSQRYGDAATGDQEAFLRVLAP